MILSFSDIDECVAGTHNCSVDAVCNNTKEAYNCTCNPGYQGDGRECQGNSLMWRSNKNVNTFTFTTEALFQSINLSKIILTLQEKLLNGKFSG